MLHKTKEIKIVQPFRVEFFFPAAEFYRSLGTTGLARLSKPELHELVFNSQALDPLSVFAKIYNKKLWNNLGIYVNLPSWERQNGLFRFFTIFTSSRMFINFMWSESWKSETLALLCPECISQREENAFQLGCVEKKKPRGWFRVHKDIQGDCWPRKFEVDIQLQLFDLKRHTQALSGPSKALLPNFTVFRPFPHDYFFIRPPVY